MPTGQRRPLPIVPLSSHAHLRVQEVAAYLRVSQSVVYSLVNEGDMPAKRIGRLIRIPRQDFLTWFCNNPAPQ